MSKRTAAKKPSPGPRMRRFGVTLTCYAEIELDEAVIEAVDDKWREALWKIHTPNEIASHVAYNLIVNRINLESMDGWADKPNDMARIADEDWEVDAEELTEKKR